MTVNGGYGEGGYGEGPYGGAGGGTRTYSQATEDAYARLPDFYREADRDGVLKRWMSALFDQIGEMRVLRERFALEPSRPGSDRPTGELLDRAAAGLPVVGPWAAVLVADGAVGLRSDGPGPDPAHTEWEVQVGGGTYELSMGYEAGPDRGLLRLEVDGLVDRVIDTYSPAVTVVGRASAIGSVTLTRGFHTVRAYWTGGKRAASTGTAIVVTGFSLRNLSGLALDGSDLVDPSTADPAWLGWLAQIVGARLPAELTSSQRRDAVRQAARLNAGSQDALVGAARTALSGNRSVVVYPHTRVSGGVKAAGGPWDLTVVTNGTETPSSAAVLDAIRRLDAKPAGVRLFHIVYAGTWSTFHSSYPTWSAIHARSTWGRLQEASLDAPVLADAALRAPAALSAASVRGRQAAAVLAAPAGLSAAATVTTPV